MLITLLNFSHNLPHGTVLRGGAVVSLKCLNKRLFLSPRNGLCFVQTTKLCKGRAFPTGSGRTFVLKPELQWSYNDPAMTKSWLILHMLPIFCPSPDSPLIISVLATYMACWSLAVFMFDSAAFWNVLNLNILPNQLQVSFIKRSTLSWWPDYWLVESHHAFLWVGPVCHLAAPDQVTRGHGWVALDQWMEVDSLKSRSG